MPISDIKCGKFCLYNKKLFCPFYYEIDLPKTEQKIEKIPSKIKTKKSSIKPTPKINKKNNPNNPNEFETVWMSFEGEIINQIFSAHFEGKMTDLKLGEFKGEAIPKEEDNFNLLSFSAKISTNDKNCDFGGNIEFNLKILDKNNKETNYFLTGKLITFYKSGGTTLPSPDDIVGNDNEDFQEEVSKKYYDGKITFFDNEIFNSIIKLYTDM